MGCCGLISAWPGLSFISSGPECKARSVAGSPGRPITASSWRMMRRTSFSGAVAVVRLGRRQCRVHIARASAEVVACWNWAIRSRAQKPGRGPAHPACRYRRIAGRNRCAAPACGLIGSHDLLAEQEAGPRGQLDPGFSAEPDRGAVHDHHLAGAQFQNQVRHQAPSDQPAGGPYRQRWRADRGRFTCGPGASLQALLTRVSSVVGA